MSQVRTSQTRWRAIRVGQAGFRCDSAAAILFATRRSLTARGLGCRAGSLFLLMTLFAGTQLEGADAVSIQQLMADKQAGRWNTYAESGQAMTIEGRCASVATSLLRFQNCDLNFYWHEENAPFPSLSPRGGRTLEVAGHFAFKSGKPAFLVDQLRESPSDHERLRLRKIGLLDASADAWYALGNWAMKRAGFYNDPDLQSDAREIDAEGLRRERRALPDDALDAKIALAPKFAQFGLPDAQRVDFLHESFARRWDSMKKENVADLDQFAAKLKANLRGCQTPPAGRDDQLRNRYRANPIAVYASSSSNVRARLNRILYADVLLAALKAAARRDLLDDLQLADRIDQQVPEFHAEAENLRSHALDDKLAHVAALTRQEALALADVFTSRGQQAKAAQAKKDWVQARTSQLQKEGRPSDLAQAAREYQTLLDDNETAARLYIEAYEKAPAKADKEIVDQLNHLGWTLVNGKWITQAQAAALSLDPATQKAQTGGFVGMSRDQIRKALGNPDSVTRVVSAGRVNEVWIYTDNANSRVVVHFLGGPTLRDAKVVRLVQ